MNKIIVISALGGLVIGGLIGFGLGAFGTGGGHYRHDMYEDMHSSNKQSDGGQTGTDATAPLGGMMDHSMHDSMMVTSERAFIEGMIPHHEEAIKTANEVLARGATTPEIRALAEDIISAQTKEVADMKVWYQTWYNATYTPSTNYKPMMRELKDLSGVTLDRVFLEDMVMHHMGAIMMARSVESHIEHDEMRTLTTNIISSQSEEIALMQQLLSTIK